MPTEKLAPTRRGIAVTVTLDYEAAAILDALAPSRRTMGRTISRLLHNEQVRREEQGRRREVFGQIVPEPVCP